MRQLTNKEKRLLYEYVKNNYGVDDRNIKKSNVFYDENNNVIIIDKVISFIVYNNEYIPTIFYIVSKDLFLPYVVVDEGAVKHILNGADVFRPGIIEISEDVKKDNIVVVLSKDKKLLAVGIALYDSNSMSKLSKGKVIKNIHYYGDKITKLQKSLKF